MTTKSKEIGNKKSRKSPTFLSQAEIIRKINQSTRNSYKYFELLVESKNGYGSEK